MAITRRQWFELTVTVDSQPIRLKIKRLSPDEFDAFQFQLKAFGAGRGAPLAPLSDSEPDPATRELIQAHADWLRANAEWQQQVFEDYVRVHPGDLFDEDDQGQKVEVLTGRHFARVFGGHSVVPLVLTRILTENCLSDEQKKRLSSLFDSSTGSNTTPSQEAAGASPAPTATSAEPEASVERVAATASLDRPSSGTMPPFVSTRVQ